MPKRKAGTAKAAKAAKRAKKEPTAETVRPAELEDDLTEARKRLHVSVVPDSAPCRETEYWNIYMNISDALNQSQGACLYISGVPGTGKTLTVTRVLKELKQKAEEEGGQIEPFECVEINGMKLTEPSYAYQIVWNAISKKKATNIQAAEELEKYFSGKSSNSRGKNKRKMFVVLLDELDQMITQKQTVVYNFLNWPTRANSNLIVVAVANTMDLPERYLANKISSRAGLNRIDFAAYTFPQLEQIIAHRLEGLECFDAQAIRLCAKKVTSVSGDARRALDICRRAAELARERKTKVNLNIVCEAVDEIYMSPDIKMITSMSRHEKLFIYAVITLIRETGLTTTTLGAVTDRHIKLCRTHMFTPPPTSIVSYICAKLKSSRIILAQGGKAGIFQKIELGTPVENCLIALRQDKEFEFFVKDNK